MMALPTALGVMLCLAVVTVAVRTHLVTSVSRVELMAAGADRVCLRPDRPEAETCPGTVRAQAGCTPLAASHSAKICGLNRTNTHMTRHAAPAHQFHGICSPCPLRGQPYVESAEETAHCGCTPP